MKPPAIVLKLLVPAFLTLLVVGTAAASYYFYTKSKKLEELMVNSPDAAKKEAEELLTKIGALIELPTNEQPTIATISDTEQLKDQIFFSRAVNGDKVLVYTQSKKIIIYRPSINKIIDVGTVNVSGNESSKSVAGATTEIPSTDVESTRTYKVAVYNGTQTVGYAATKSTELAEKVKDVQIVLKDNANKGDYSKSIVVDLSGIAQDKVAEIASFFSGEIGGLPEGEVAPSGVDILVILGN